MACTDHVTLLTKEDGALTLVLARKAIEACLKAGRVLSGGHVSADMQFPPSFNERRGVFVTLKKREELRGCIGHPYADSSLKDALVDSAISAGFRDPRFPPVGKEEMHDITIEVTVLTQPVLMTVPVQDIPSSIELGRHGLIISSARRQGLLLPQVAVEHGMDVVEFLGHTCLKAGLSPDAWMKGAEVYTFEGQIFTEKE